MRLRLICAVMLVVMVDARLVHAQSADAEETHRAIHTSVAALTDVMVHDIFSPPQASRTYAYALIAFYEAMRHREEGFLSYAGQLNGLTDVPAPDPSRPLNWTIAGTQAFTRVARAMTFSEDVFTERTEAVLSGIASLEGSPEVARASAEYGDRVAQHILTWAAADGYSRTRSLPRYRVVASHGATWEPTPPGYMDAVEPYWGHLRPFLLSSSDQFRPPPPPEFSMVADSAFYRDAMHVYTVTSAMRDEEAAIAAFWDCNPFVLHQRGHVTFGLKKMSPGAHWIGIGGIAIDANGSSPVQALATYSLVAIALADGFIACWEEKYRSNVVRPETVIRRHIDPNWHPLLQTPPFPEYPSGHSVISVAAATVLTSIYGDMAYLDDVEVDYGITPRHFNSFMEAAEEAAISRLYGGIHYLPAIEHGRSQGRRIGESIVSRIRLSPTMPHPSRPTRNAARGG